MVSLPRGKVRGVILVAACLLVQAAALAAPARISVSFTGADVVVSGATPNGQVVLVGLARQPLGDRTRVVPYCQLLDSGRDGTAHFPINGSLDWKSVWGAVDLTTGDTVVGHPDRSPGRQAEWRGKGLGRDGNGKLNRIEQQGDWLLLMLVQPSGDVFQSSVVDGGPADEDKRSDGTITLSLDSFETRRGKGSRPDEARPGDVLFVMNVDDLSMVAERVK